VEIKCDEEEEEEAEERQNFGLFGIALQLFFIYMFILSRTAR